MSRARSQAMRTWVCLRRAMVGVYMHGALGYAKGAAYSALLAFFPLLTTVTTLLVNANAERVARRIVAAVFRIAPGGVEDLIAQFLAERGQRPLALPVIAFILAVWAASGVMMSLMEGFQAAFGVKSRRNIFHQRGIAMWLVVTSIVPMIATTSLLIFGDRIQTMLLTWTGVLETGETLRGGVLLLSNVLRYAVAFLTIWLVTAMLYYFGPDAGRSRSIWPGALLGGLLWLLITLTFGWYVRNIANYNVLYGSIGAVIALCVWMWLLSIVTMIGNEFNVARDQMDVDRDPAG